MTADKNAGSQDVSKRRIMRALKINEISGVDVPAQEGATAVILKRKDGDAGKKKKTPKTEAKPAVDDGTVGTQEDKTMTTDKTQTDADAAVVDLTKQLARANSVAALNDAEKTHFATLEGEHADGFLTKSRDERQADLDSLAKAATDADPVAYTTLDGVVLHKSAGAGFIALAKSNDDLRKRLEKSEAVAETASLEKRVNETLAHLPGDMATRVAMLKAIDGIENEQRTASLAALKAQSDVLGKSFDTLGVSNAPVPGSPADDLEKMAAEHQASNPGMSIEKAYDVVSQTEAGAELYAKTVN